MLTKEKEVALPSIDYTYTHSLFLSLPIVFPLNKQEKESSLTTQYWLRTTFLSI